MRAQHGEEERVLSLRMITPVAKTLGMVGYVKPCRISGGKLCARGVRTWMVVMMIKKTVGRLDERIRLNEL
jgi:hypothetical protein